MIRNMASAPLFGAGILNALNDSSKQQAQAEAELTKGAKVLVIAAVHGARAPAGLPERVLVRRYRGELGQHLLARATSLRQLPVHAEPAGVRISTHQARLSTPGRPGHPSRGASRTAFSPHAASRLSVPATDLKSSSPPLP